MKIFAFNVRNSKFWFPEVFGGPGRFTKVREACSNISSEVPGTEQKRITIVIMIIMMIVIIRSPHVEVVVAFLVVNFFGFLDITRHHGSFEGCH